MQRLSLNITLDNPVSEEEMRQFVSRVRSLIGDEAVVSVTVRSTSLKTRETNRDD